MKKNKEILRDEIKKKFIVLENKRADLLELSF